MLTPNLAFWAGSLLWMAALVAVALRGVLRVRRGDVDAHRRAMNLAVAMVLGFVVAYALKVVLLGKENLAIWSSWDRGVLYFHETMVAIMLIGGGTARWLGRRMGPGGGATARMRTIHRRAGRTALVAGSLALFTALLILLGMVRRQEVVAVDAAARTVHVVEIPANRTEPIP